MNDILEQMLSRYPMDTADARRNALYEVMQQIVLCGLYRGGFFSEAAFYGGTCLRIFHGLQRYSEDMDFSLLQPDESFRYLLAYDLLAKDVESLASDIRLAKIDGPVPELYQEALLVPWITAGGKADYDRDFVSDKVLAKAQAFLKDLQTGRTTSYMKGHYGKTFWFYYASK